MKEPIIFRRDDCLSHERAMYWKDLLYRTVKIGTEIEFAMPKGVRKKDFLPPLVKALRPTNNLGDLGHYGVLDVISEHCGIEIQVIGRQPYFPELLKQYRSIINPLLERGVRARPICGLHYHMLTMGLGEPVPEIVLANIWNLTRRYAPNLRFITSGGDRWDALCRCRRHTSHLELVQHTPGNRTMEEIQSILKDSNHVPEHQNFLNLEHVEFNQKGEVDHFHVEFRFPDADLSPTAITAKTFLFLAMLLKAVEMSQHGVIHVGRIQEWRRKKTLLEMLNNNRGNLATSDSSEVTPEIIEELREGCYELLELLKPLFTRFARVSYDSNDEHPAFAVLSSLAQRPISLLRANGKDWLEIEKILEEKVQKDLQMQYWDDSDQRLMRFIELAESTGHPSSSSWKWESARKLLLTPQELESRLERLDQWRGLVWDAELGSMIFLG